MDGDTDDSPASKRRKRNAARKRIRRRQQTAEERARALDLRKLRYQQKRTPHVDENTPLTPERDHTQSCTPCLQTSQPRAIAAPGKRPTRMSHDAARKRLCRSLQSDEDHTEALELRRVRYQRRTANSGATRVTLQRAFGSLEEHTRRERSCKRANKSSVGTSTSSEGSTTTKKNGTTPRTTSKSRKSAATQKRLARAFESPEEHTHRKEKRRKRANRSGGGGSFTSTGNSTSSHELRLPATGTNVARHDCGPLNQRCHHCNALSWRLE